ncbi:hypothetical protein SAMN04488084_1142 [Pedobacter antarcticus]|nr:hypothetical protein SAMN04488084_1142 [Pedobacter antarcticus]
MGQGWGRFDATPYINGATKKETRPRPEHEQGETRMRGLECLILKWLYSLLN